MLDQKKKFTTFHPWQVLQLNSSGIPSYFSFSVTILQSCNYVLYNQAIPSIIRSATNLKVWPQYWGKKCVEESLYCMQYVFHVLLTNLKHKEKKTCYQSHHSKDSWFRKVPDKSFSFIISNIWHSSSSFVSNPMLFPYVMETLNPFGYLSVPLIQLPFTVGINIDVYGFLTQCQASVNQV